MIIRPYVREDYEGVRTLAALSDALHRERAPWMFRTPDREPRPPEEVERQIAASRGALLVADDASAVIGFVQIAMREAPPSPILVQQHWGVIDGLVVAPSKRRQGVGRALLTAAEVWIENAGASWAELNVYAANLEALAFYEATGYAPMIHRMRKSF